MEASGSAISAVHDAELADESRRTFAYPMTFGATWIAPGSARFRFYAPSQAEVFIELAGVDLLQPMQRREDGWFEAQVECEPGALYRYVLEDGLRVPDPASRAQAGDIYDFSRVVDPRAYAWRNTEWRGLQWEKIVLYELHCGLLGGFAGVARELPRLAKLGITAIELMPINDFPGSRNWGYDGALPYAPDRAYGAPDDLKALIDTAHGLGLAVFLDVVYNHFGPDGNYLASYAPSFFRSGSHTPWGSAIDFTQEPVRRFYIDNALYWLNEYRFDGLRLDAVHAIEERPFLRDLGEAVRAGVASDRHVHLVLEDDFNKPSDWGGAILAQWNDDFHHVLHVLLTGETEGYYADYAEHASARLARSLAQGFVYQGEASPHRDGEKRGEPSGDMSLTSFVSFLQNHDQIGNRAFGERLTLLTDRNALEAATALQLLCPQIPLIFMGEEVASETPFLYFTDFHDDLADAVREGRRREFDKFKSFADPKRRAQIPDPNAPDTYTASWPRPGALGATRNELYSQLLKLRAGEIAPRLQGCRSIGAKPLAEAGAVAQWRMGDGAVLTIAINLGGESVALDAPKGNLLHESRPGAGGAAQAGELPARACVAFLEVSNGLEVLK